MVSLRAGRGAPSGWGGIQIQTGARGSATVPRVYRPDDAETVCVVVAGGGAERPGANRVACEEKTRGGGGQTRPRGVCGSYRTKGRRDGGRTSEERATPAVVYGLDYRVVWRF